MGSLHKMESSDIISNLPEQVIGTILVHLPIRDAVGTSLLSKNWRYKWTSIPNLVFNEDNICSSTTDKNLRTYKLMNFVDRFLLNHSGSIYKFELISSYYLQGSVIDSWIRFLSRNGVKEIVLQFSTEKRYEVHSSFFSCEAICCMSLFRCILKPPPMFKGFRDLRSLILERVTLADEVLESMISSCTVLEIIRLIQLKGCSCIKICAPILQHFYFEGVFSDICIIDAPHLSFVFISLDANVVDKPVGRGEFSNLVSVLGCLTALEKLVICDYFMEFLAMGNLPNRLPVTYDCLKSISLEVNLEDLNHALVMLCLFQSSPNLQELEMVVSTTKSYILAYEDVATEYIEDFWIAHGRLNCSMNQLLMVTIKMLGERLQLGFIEYILANSPVLEMLSINHISEGKVEESRVLKELLRFQRASAKAQVEYNLNL
ncbi:hypothetical protein HHK36_006897 [Tetracentron sinense]|uniref:F-box domain-containing protein n=1 Tax=Tetracentron sinense TaxID=13715 RepID=A0A835DLB5_TETSI|nr:hypothetical protein HHK36_006897 [Tetracentron sinense]